MIHRYSIYIFIMGRSNLLKKILIVTAFFVIVASTIFFFLKQSFPRSIHHTYTKSTDLHSENINGFYLFDSIHMDQFISVYGKQTNKSRNHNQYNYYKIQEGLEIATKANGGILRFIVETRAIPTSKGIKVGDAITKVKKKYGGNYYKRSEQGLNIIVYVDKKNHQSIEFWHDQKRVIFYRLNDNR